MLRFNSFCHSLKTGVIDIKSLLSLIATPAFPEVGILCPWSDDADLHKLVHSLREQGETVIQLLPNQSGNEKNMQCDRMIKNINDQWVVEKL